MATTMKELQEMREEYQKNVEKFGREALLNELQQFFEAQDRYVMIRWEQYTPYFNDGEPCTFSVYSPYFYTKEMIEEMEREGDHYYEGEYVSTWRGREKAAEDYDDVKMMAYDVAVMLNNNEDLLKAVFGDHTRVTVKPDGVHSEYYEHD